MAAAQANESVRDAVLEIWSQVLPHTPPREDLIWSEAGVDSLASLHLLLRLEERLQRRVSFDLFARDLTLADLIRSLDRETEQDPGAGAAPDPRIIFLVPGIYGDEPRLADFRRSLGEWIRCETLALPEIDQPAALLGDIEATAQALKREIEAIQPAGPVVVAGYSFGGLVALQIALDLMSAGRNIELLCLLDPIPMAGLNPQDVEPNLSTPKPMTHRFRPQKGEGAWLYLERLLFRRLIALRRFELARRLIRATSSRYSFDRSFERRRTLLGALRGVAMQRWTAKPCPARTLLIASETSRTHDLPRYWAEICPDMSIVSVDANHWKIFDPGAVEQINSALKASLRPRAEGAELAIAGPADPAPVLA